jgi:RNA polymerase sigma factor (sigma-70 family)
MVVRNAFDITARRKTMGKGQPGSALRQLRGLFAAGTATGLTDSQLLERYAAKRAESADAAIAADMAFAALVDRHGAMVWGVVHRVLGDAHEAEDAFQAAFLILVRKAGSVRVDGSLGRWLYGVAHRVALRARFEAERRQSGIDRAPPTSSGDPVGEVELRDLRNAVGEELDRLPAKYRCPVELCHLQGMTYEQAARQLNWPVATVKGRLKKGRLKLRQRLTQRGLSAGAVAVGVATALTGEARAAVPLELVQSTARAGAACATGTFAAGVTHLTEGVLRMMMWEKLKLVALGALIAVGLTAKALSQQAPNGGILAARLPQSVAQKAEKPNEKSVGDRRWVRSLPSGALIEVIGVSSFPSGPDTWWRPDGSPLQQAPCDPIEPGISGGDDAVRKLVLVRLARIPKGADHEWSVTEARGQGEGPAMRNGKPLPGLSETTALLPADAGTCTVLFKVAAGPWKTIRTWGKNPGGVASRVGPSFIFSDAIATKKGTTLAVTHDIQDKPVRLVAVDVDGKELPAEVRSGTSVKDFWQIVVEFDQPPEQIKEFWLQTRPYEEVRIPRIALKRK